MTDTPSPHIRLLATDSLDGHTKKSVKLYDRRRLFDAVANGDLSELDGLLSYLLKTSKQLTDDDFKGSRACTSILLGIWKEHVIVWEMGRYSCRAVSPILPQS